jgi:hypothetical protein
MSPHQKTVRDERRILRPQLLLIIALLATVSFLFQSQERVQVAEAAVNVDLDQWANDDAEWQNGNLNGNNSVYAENLVVPFRYAVEGLDPGQHTFHINYDFTAGGHEAYDFLATYTATESVAGNICDTGGGAVSSMCPSLPTPVTAAFPSDTFSVDGLTVSGAESAAGYSRNLTLWGGTIDNITAPTHSGSTTGNSTGDLVVTFTVAGCDPGLCAALFAWGGHLADSSYWNPPEDGAGQISGAPWHMRTQNFDDGGASNQDRSIQPTALVADPDVSIAKTNDTSDSVAVGGSFNWTLTLTVTNGPTTAVANVTDTIPAAFSVGTVTSDAELDCSASSGNSIDCDLASGTADGTYVVTVPVTAPDGSPSTECTLYTNTGEVSGGGGTNTTASDDDSVTVVCEPELASISIAKNVPGTDSQNFGFSDNIPGCSIGTLDDDPGSGTPKSATCSSITPGTYTVSENVPSGWFLDDIDCSGSGDWDIDVNDEEVTITVAAGESVSCTFQNDPEEVFVPTPVPTQQIQGTVATPTPSPTPIEEVESVAEVLPSTGSGGLAHHSSTWIVMVAAMLLGLGSTAALMSRRGVK